MADEKIRSGRAGKTAGRLLLLLSTVILIAAIVFSSYMGGQSKLMSKLTAYYKSGTIDKIGTLISDTADKDGLLRDIQNSWDMESAIYGDDLSVRYKFESRSAMSSDEFIYNCEVTFYGGDNPADKRFYSVLMVRENGTWRIAGYNRISR